MADSDALAPYRAKRDFKLTPEPAEGVARMGDALSFVIQKHAARNLHYDFRLELQGTLKSWAVPKGPSLDPGVKRMAVQVEDHPVSYAAFEGTIPAKQYGAGNVIVWDRGVWIPVGDPVAGLRSGKLKFELQGEKLKGGWTLVRMHGRAVKGHEPWLLIKERDGEARPEGDFNVLEALPGSVITGQRLPGKAMPESANQAKTGAVKKRQVTSATPPGVPEGAVKAALPKTLAPQLATRVDEIPTDPEDWVYEIKFDRYRLLARIDGGSVRCITRNGNDWTAKLPGLAEALARLDIGSGWLDGEIVAMNKKGVPDFGALLPAARCVTPAMSEPVSTTKPLSLSKRGCLRSTPTARPLPTCPVGSRANGSGPTRFFGRLFATKRWGMTLARSWNGYETSRKGLAGAMKILGFKPAA